MISDEALRAFKKIWREEFNEEISDEEGVTLGTNLLVLFDHIWRPVKKEWLDAISDKKESINENEHNSIPNKK